MRYLIPASCALVAAFTLPVMSSTLLDSSEKTYARECLDYAADGDDLIQICENALLEGKFGKTQHVKLLRALGDAYRWNDQPDKAEAAYRNILQVQPQSADTMNGLGWIEYGQDNYPRAVEFFEQSIAINPTNDGLGGYGSAGFHADLLSADEALEYLEAAHSIQPKDRWTIRQKGWILFDSRRYEDALEPFQAAIALDSEDVNALKGMAKSLAELERYDEAQTYINTAADLSPENVSVLVWRSHISRWNGHNLRALKDAGLVITLRPDKSDGYVLKARAESGMGFDALAIETLRNASERLTGNEFVRYWLASVLQDDDQSDEAFALIQLTITDGAPDEYDYKLAASLALDLGHLEQAREAISAGRAIAPWMYEFGYYKSRLLVLEGAFDQAEQVFDAAVQNGLDESYARHLAQLMIKQGEVKRAIAFKARYKS